MKIIKLFIFVILSVFTFSASADVYVDQYQRKDGTIVREHKRSDPDGSRNNNWSTQGNQNPYTGEYGSKPRDGGF